MKPLIVYRRMLKWYCVYPVEETTPKWTKLMVKMFCACAFVFCMIGVGFSLAFVLKLISVDLASSLYALFQVAAAANGIYNIIIQLVIRHKITKTIENLSKIYGKCNYKTKFV